MHTASVTQHIYTLFTNSMYKPIQLQNIFLIPLIGVTRLFLCIAQFPFLYLSHNHKMVTISQDPRGSTGRLLLLRHGGKRDFKRVPDSGS